jgi:hypothetical protein
MHMFMKTWPSHMGSTPLVGRRTSSWHLAARHAGCAEDGAYEDGTSWRKIEAMPQQSECASKRLGFHHAWLG